MVLYWSVSLYFISNIPYSPYVCENMSALVFQHTTLHHQKCKYSETVIEMISDIMRITRYWGRGVISIIVWLLTCLFQMKCINSLLPSDTIWRQKFYSTLAPTIACCLRHQTITWTNVDLSNSDAQCTSDNHLRSISQKDTSAINH